jgi:hypothetical protein
MAARPVPILPWHTCGRGTCCLGWVLGYRRCEFLGGYVTDLPASSAPDALLAASRSDRGAVLWLVQTLWLAARAVG